ncbi:hypothetical protein [Stygiolobus caldivivus]|uniref:Uncharacterized protein n=1 Tax=Stygiolobus caldivivus TaxID=2824673 RepID=A0A8D5U758_9CREN|nr:hypothetical protein [Stygiolobus caldivivus]BCU70945.1 hypothetical protein KN1_22420 [Stygiolobus caldivivus]
MKSRSRKGLGTVIGIVIFILILLVALALILSYLGEFQAVGAQLSQAQINIYDHNNAKLGVSPSIQYLESSQIYQGQCQEFSHSGSRYVSCSNPYDPHYPGYTVYCDYYYQFHVKVYQYSDPQVSVTVSNPSQITQTVEYLILASGAPDAQYTSYIASNQQNSPPNYQSLAKPELTQLVIQGVGHTIAPSSSYTATVTCDQLYSPYLNDPASSPVDLYIPYQYYQVKIEVYCFEVIHYSYGGPTHTRGPWYIGTHYYAYYSYEQYKLYDPYYGAPPTIGSYVPTDWHNLPTSPVTPYGNVYFIAFTNFGNEAHAYVPLPDPY